MTDWLPKSMLFFSGLLKQISYLQVMFGWQTLRYYIFSEKNWSHYLIIWKCFWSYFYYYVRFHHKCYCYENYIGILHNMWTFSDHQRRKMLYKLCSFCVLFCALWYWYQKGKSSTAGCPTCRRPRHRLIQKRTIFGGPVNWLEEKYHLLELFDGRRRKEDLYNSMESWLTAEDDQRKLIEMDTGFQYSIFKLLNLDLTRYTTLYSTVSTGERQIYIFSVFCELKKNILEMAFNMRKIEKNESVLR